MTVTVTVTECTCVCNHILIGSCFKTCVTTWIERWLCHHNTISIFFLVFRFIVCCFLMCVFCCYSPLSVFLFFFLFIFINAIVKILGRTSTTLQQNIVYLDTLYIFNAILGNNKVTFLCFYIAMRFVVNNGSFFLSCVCTYIYTYIYKYIYLFRWPAKHLLNMNRTNSILIRLISNILLHIKQNKTKWN